MTWEVGVRQCFLPGTLVPLTTGISYELVAKWQKERQNRKRKFQVNESYILEMILLPTLCVTSDA